MKVVLIPFFAILLSLSTRANASEGCYRKHLVDAIAINKARKPLYSSLTNGKSKRVSNNMITMETVLLPIARIQDRLAGKYQRNGLPIFCEDLIDMEETPDFQGQQEPLSTDPLDMKPVEIYLERMKKNLQTFHFSEVEKDAALALEYLASRPNYHCLVRHFIESIRRGADLAEKYHQKALSEEIRSPRKLSRSFLKFHLTGMNWGMKIDRLAAPVQKQGIPIVCTDVPHIPLSDWN